MDTKTSIERSYRFGYNQYWTGGFIGLCFFFVQEHPKAQPAVVLKIKHIKRRCHSLKSHLTDWEKPGIEPATPDLQGIGLSPTLFVDFLRRNQFCLVGLRFVG